MVPGGGRRIGMARNRSSDTPFLGGPDTLEITVNEHPFTFRSSKDQDLNALIVAAVNGMGAVGDDAEETYRRALGALAGRADEAMGVILAEYEDLPEEQYLDRWSLVHLISELRLPGAVKALNRIITSRVPAERAPDSHDISTVTEEVMIRTTAVEGVVRLSADGVEEARRVLLRHARNRTFSIRRACVQGLMETGTDEDKKELRSLLKERGEERLLEIRRMDVREVPQAIGGRFVVHPDVKDAPPSHDLGSQEG
jgi:hypothetical protein